MFRTFLSGVFGGLMMTTGVMAAPPISDAQDWLLSQSGRPADWLHAGSLMLDTGGIFIGDPSWGGDYHLRNAQDIDVRSLEVWLLVEQGSKQINLVWLEAVGTAPDSVAGGIEFGMDAAYFAFGDRQAGADLANIGDLELPDAPDSFEFLMPIVQRDGFSWAEVAVPPEDRPIFVINTGRDGGLKAAWIKDGQGRLSGILIDISGRLNDGVFLDRLLRNGE